MSDVIWEAELLNQAVGPHLSSDVDYGLTWVERGNREVPRPWVEVASFRHFLEDAHTSSHGDEAVRLTSCAYRHYYWCPPEQSLLDPKFEFQLAESPIYTILDVGGPWNDAYHTPTSAHRMD